MTVDALDRPVKAEVFRPLSFRRRITNSAATIFFLASFLVALVPLFWVLSIVIARGWYAVTRSGWWTHSLRGVLPNSSSAASTTRCTGPWCRQGWPPPWPCRWA